LLRGCDFFDFSQKVALKTTGLDAKKSPYRKKVTASQKDNVKPKQRQGQCDGYGSGNHNGYRERHGT
jgi:hypothetical protein